MEGVLDAYVGVFLLQRYLMSDSLLFSYHLCQREEVPLEVWASILFEIRQQPIFHLCPDKKFRNMQLLEDLYSTGKQMQVMISGCRGDGCRSEAEQVAFLNTFKFGIRSVSDILNSHTETAFNQAQLLSTFVETEFKFNTTSLGAIAASTWFEYCNLNYAIDHGDRLNPFTSKQTPYVSCQRERPQLVAERVSYAKMLYSTDYGGGFQLGTFQVLALTVYNFDKSVYVDTRRVETYFDVVAYVGGLYSATKFLFVMAAGFLSKLALRAELIKGLYL